MDKLQNRSGSQPQPSVETMGSNGKNRSEAYKTRRREAKKRRMHRGVFKFIDLDGPL